MLKFDFLLYTNKESDVCKSDNSLWLIVTILERNHSAVDPFHRRCPKILDEMGFSFLDLVLFVCLTNRATHFTVPRDQENQILFRFVTWNLLSLCLKRKRLN